jgi:hypothetical protein
MMANLENDHPADGSGSQIVNLDAMTRVIRQNGRWVVMMNVPTWNSKDEHQPITNHWKPIMDFATEAQAVVTAQWYLRAANRSPRRLTGF